MNNKTKVFTLLAAFVSGVLLTYLNTYVLGFLAAQPVPKGYFLWFGENLIVAFAGLNFFLYAMPLLLVAVIWSLVTFKIIHANTKQVVIFCIAGYIVSSVVSEIQFELSGNHYHSIYIVSSVVSLIQFELSGNHYHSILFELSNIFHALAPILGIWMSSYFLSKNRKSAP